MTPNLQNSVQKTGKQNFESTSEKGYKHQGTPVYQVKERI